MSACYCRDCLAPVVLIATKAQPRRCPACGSPRLIAHEELDTLTIAHVDCDAFFASVEKRDRPELRDKPVIVGGGQRGVVSTCCYIARIHGVRSAMPMFKARKLCPQAIIIKPDMARYAAVGADIRRHMLALTPLVEPLSIDEAFLDLGGTQRLHHGPPVLALLRFAQKVERDVGVTVSIGLSHNKSMAKMASDMDKPRGFAVIGREQTVGLLAPMPVRALFGVGAAMARLLEQKGYSTLADLQNADPALLVRHLGEHGARLQALASGIDPRPVCPDRERKSVSSERTFHEDIAERDALRAAARSACERVSAQLKAKGLCGWTVTLKVKTADFRTLTRSQGLPTPTQGADRLFRTVEPLLASLANGTHYRLLGVGVADLADAREADDRDMADAAAQRRSQAERAMDALRARFGPDAVGVGLAMPAMRKAPAGQAREDQGVQGSERKAAKSASSPSSVKVP